MVIQSNMVPRLIVEVWEETADVLKKYNVPLTDEPLEALVKSDKLTLLLQELNDIAGNQVVEDCG